MRGSDNANSGRWFLWYTGSQKRRAERDIEIDFVIAEIWQKD